MGDAWGNADHSDETSSESLCFCSGSCSAWADRTKIKYRKLELLFEIGTSRLEQQKDLTQWSQMLDYFD